MDQLEPGSPAYLIPGALEVDGQINVEVLERSFQELIDRHESLRTTFEERDGQPMQVIHPAGPSRLPVIDLQGLGEEQREQDRKSTRLNSSHMSISYAVFCLKKKKKANENR